VAAGAVSPLPLTSARAFPARADQIGEARKFLAQVLDGFRAADDAILCASELVTNSVSHSNSRRPGGVFTVRAGMRPGGRVRVEVEDQGGAWTQQVCTDGQHGRGLLIVGRLARDWGIGGSQAGWVVWCEFGRPGRPPPSRVAAGAGEPSSVDSVPGYGR
jgi:anti-sigma regulatory factor (Ser/Thr protein kinase)